MGGDKNVLELVVMVVHVYEMAWNCTHQKINLRKTKISFTSKANCHLGSQEDQLEEEITLGLSLLSIFVALIKTLKEIIFPKP